MHANLDQFTGHQPDHARPIVSKLVNPHGGGSLRPLLLEGAELAEERKRAHSLPRVTVTSRENGDLIMLGIGGFTPLDGFMTHADWEGVCDGMRTSSGLFWPIPITLSTDDTTAATFRTGNDIALVDPDNGEILATMKVTEKYQINKAHECATVFRTADIEHPGVKMVMEQGEVNLAGPVKVLSHGGFPERYGPIYATPAETRPLKIDWTFWCYRCGGMASDRTCPHQQEDRLLLSGTKLRKMLSDGTLVPAEFSRPEVLEILAAYYGGIKAEDRVEVKLSGHSAR